MISENDYTQVMEECFMTYIEGFIRHARTCNHMSDDVIRSVVINWTDFYLQKIGQKNEF